MIFFKKKSYDLLEKIDIKGKVDKFYMHKYLKINFFMLYNIT